MEKRFAFGKNWKRFIERSFSPKVLEEGTRSLSAFLGTQDLAGLSFLDVGCGSGLHSLAAHTLGAEVMSTDVDADSVECTAALKADAKKRQNAAGKKWDVRQISMLDAEGMKSLGTFDIVYCWGVAHHTGDMDRALQNLAAPVKKGGLLFVAIYNLVEGRRGSRMWHRIKKFYNTSPLFLKKILEWAYIGGNFITLVFHGRNPFAVMRHYASKRGMSWSTDLVDWLGGYPYEYASVGEIFRFYRDRGFKLMNIKTTNYIGCNQFLFMKE